MLSFDDALQCILENTPILPQIRVLLTQSPGYVLAEPITSPFDMPRFDNSAMDGFGVRLADIENASEATPAKLAVTEIIQAGSNKTSALISGTAVKIMTGAPVPPSVDAIVMKEYCDTRNGHVLIKRSARLSDNIRKQGEEFCQGQVVLNARTLITPAVLGLLATLGYGEVPVYAKPRIGIVATGNELVEPGKPLGSG